MTLRLLSPELLTVSGAPLRSSTTSEHVASKPMPLTTSGDSAASAMAARTDVAQAFQISAEDCSTISPASCHVRIGLRAVASRFPCSSKIPARVLDVPTSIPIKTWRMVAPVNSDASLPASVAAIDKNDAAGHQTRRIRGKEQHHGRNLLDLAEPGHGRAADPGVVHAGIALHEGVQRGFDIGRRHRI